MALGGVWRTSQSLPKLVGAGGWGWGVGGGAFPAAFCLLRPGLGNEHEMSNRIS